MTEATDTLVMVSAEEAPHHRYDRLLLVAVAALMGLGLVMVYSASAVRASLKLGDPAFFLKRQLLYLGPAAVCFSLGALVHHHRLKRLAPWILGGAVVALCLVFVPGLGVTVKGASRWITLGLARFQPSELVKVAFVVYLAARLTDISDRIHIWRVAWLPNLMALGAIGLLLMSQPDFGSTLICGGMLILMLWVAGARWRHLLGLVAAIVPLLVLAVWHKPYRMKRLLAFLSPESDTQGAAYHINQALISFGAGDWTGLGLGASRQKLLYLPEAHTDFILSILGEELGFLGVCAVIALFVILVWRGWTIARQATTPFGQMLAYGITAMLGFQATTNMAVVMALLPTKGLTLPFVSFGGSSLIMTALMVGVLLNISRRLPPPGEVA